GPMSAADFAAGSPANFTNISYATYPGAFYGRPTTSDPQFTMKTIGHPIDASHYRSLCFTQEVFGTQNLNSGNGSVARVFWATSSSPISVTKDIVLTPGLVEYCMPDLADATAVPLESGSTQPWAGSLTYFRMDPDE